MTKSPKKRYLLVVLLLLLGLALVACGGETAVDDVDTTGGEAGDEPVEVDEGEQDEVDAGTEEEITLVYWSMWNENEPQAQVIQSWIAAFEEEHPNITIEATWNGRQNQTLVRTALESGTEIDLVDQDADPLAGGLMLEGRGYLLTDFLDTPTLDTDEPIRDVFTPGVLDLFSAEDGTVYLWPYIYNTVQFWYNADMFAEAGAEPPETWAEFMEVNQAILDAGYAPIATESDVAVYQADYLTNYVQRVKGTGFLLETIEDQTGEMWRDPVYLEAAQSVRDLWDQGYIPEESIGYIWPAGQQTVGFGEAAMELVGSWVPIELSDIVSGSFEWGAFNFPAIEGGEGSQQDLEVALLAFMILEESDHPEEAFEFLRFTMTEENMQQMADEALVGVTRQGVQWADEISDGQEAAENAEIVFGFADGGIALYPEFTNNILYANWRSLFVGDLTPEEFVNTMVEDAVAFWENQ